MKRGLILWILWASFTTALGFYVVIAYILSGNAGASRGDAVPNLLLVFGINAAIMAGCSVLVRHLGLIRPLRKGILKPDSPGETARTLIVFVACWALSESIAIFGLVLRFAGHDFRTALYFVAFSLLMMFYHAPRSSVYLGQELE